MVVCLNPRGSHDNRVGLWASEEPLNLWQLVCVSGGTVWAGSACFARQLPGSINSLHQILGVAGRRNRRTDHAPSGKLCKRLWATVSSRLWLLRGKGSASLLASSLQSKNGMDFLFGKLYFTLNSTKSPFGRATFSSERIKQSF